MRAVVVFAIVVASSSAAWAGHHHHRHCTEVSEVVGRSVCRRFGSTWEMPDWVPSFGLELGIATRRLPSIAAQGASDQAARIVEPRESAMSTLGPELRLGIDLTRNWYLTTLASVGTRGMDDMVIDYGGGLGFRSFITDRTAVGIELAAGQRTYLIGRKRDRAEGEPLFDMSKDAAFVEARVRAERWLNPWLAVGAWVGSSVIERNDVAGGVFVSAFSRSYRKR